MLKSIPGAGLISAEAARALIEPVLKPHLAAADLKLVLDRELCLDDEYDRRGVLALPDGARIDGDLVLDFDLQPYDRTGWRGVLGLGRLTVTGDVVAEASDAGPFLVTCGDLSVRQIIKGGSPLVVGGRLSASGVVYCFYNHGTFRALGGVAARALILDDQAFDLDGPIDVGAVALGTEAMANVLVPDLIAKDEDGNPVPIDDVSDEIIRRMRDGEDVVRE